MKKISYLNILKILGSVAVVLIHVISRSWYDLSPNSTNFTYLTIFDSLVRWAVPIYFMVTGAIFLNEEKKITFKDLFFKYILRIFLIFFFWNMLYGCLTSIVYDHTFSLNIFMNNLLGTLQGKNVYHLWFLLLIIGFYLCVPILKLITKKENQKIIEYFLIILFIFTSLLTSLNLFFDFTFNYTILFSGYIIYFILGYYLNTFEISKNKKIIIYTLGIMGALTTIIGTIFYSRYIGAPNEKFFTYLSPNVLFMATALFTFIKSVFKNKQEIKSKIINSLIESYFGVYLMHGLVLGILEKLKIINFNIPLPLLVLLTTTIVYLITYLISFVMGKIPIIKRLIK